MGDIFLKLLNMSITAGWLVLVILVIRFLFRKIPKSICCLLWGIVAVRLLVPFSIESAFSLQPSAEPIQSTTMVEGEIMPYVPSIDSNFTFVEDRVNPVLRDTFAYQEAESVAPFQVVTEIAGGIWLGGMLLLIVFAIVSTIRLYLLVREAICYKGNVYLCDVVTTPFILGIIRPRIYLPSTLREEEMDYILAHEKAHLQRLDHLWKPIGYLILCVYWFNPLLMLAYLLLCKDIEMACDEKVIKDMSFTDKKEYSRVLLSCATQRRFILTCPLAFGEVGVKDRVKTVLNHKKTALGITILAILACIIIAICFLTNPVKEYQIRITIPAGSSAGFYYSDEEICPKRNTLTIAKGGRLGDTEVILLPVEVKEENAYDEPVYITAITPAKMDVEKGAWFKIGVNMQNPTVEDMDVYVTVRNVKVRIASKTKDEYNTNEENTEMQNSVTSQNLETQSQEPDASDVAVYEELSRVVSTVGLENAYPWNNTVDFKPNEDVLIKMASDGSGRFEIYGIMSEKYGTYGLLLNDWIGGEQNWNFAFVPWYYSGAPSDQPILESDGKGRYIFAYVYDYDGVPLWHECVLDCGYDTGHMELMPENEYHAMWLEEEQTALPSFEYTGEDKQFAAIYDFFSKREHLSSQEEVVIPTYVIFQSEVAEDEQIKVYGNFWYFSYVMNGSILECVGGMERPGVIYLKEEGEGYEVVSFDEVGDGANYTQDIKRICQGNKILEQAYYDSVDAQKSPLKDAIHRSINSYVLENKLSITAYKEYGWEPVPIIQSEEAIPIGTEFTESVNNLPEVSMLMEKYKDWEGVVEIANHSGKELGTGADCHIQVQINEKWYRLEQIYDGVWEDIAYRVPDGETTIINIDWSYVYGKLPAGAYRIVKKVHDYRTPGDYDTYYLATEFEIRSAE